MSTVKVNLKNARDAIAAKKYEDALKWSQKVLDWESANYNAHVFLGLAHQNLGQAKEGEAAFKKAILISPELPLARQGLLNFYEKLQRWQDLLPALEENLEFQITNNEWKKAAEVTTKLMDVYTREGQTDKVVEKLLTMLPGHELYDHLDEKPSEIETLRKLVTLQEQMDADFTTREVQLRRGRLGGGTLENVKATVKAELYQKSKLGETYESILRLDPDNNQDLKPKLLDFYFNQMEAVPIASKTQPRENALALANELIAAGSTLSLPYDFVIRSLDLAKAEDYDQDLLTTYESLFPESGMTKLIQAQTKYNEGEPVEDVLDLLQEGLDLVPTAVFGYLILCWLYYYAKDFETGLEYASKGRDLVLAKGPVFGLPFTASRQSFDLCMAHCYFNLDTKFGLDAMKLYEIVLSETPNDKDALQGAGIVAASRKDFAEATASFQRVLELEPENVAAKSELGWVQYQQGQFEESAKSLQEAIEEGSATSSPRAVDLYRLGRIYFDMEGEYRESKEYSYSHLIGAAKIDPNFAAAFTFLGHYYRLVAEDHARAKKCYQKAFTLDSMESDAGLYLSDYYLEEHDDEAAESVFRVATKVDRNAAWAWKRLGFTEMLQGNYIEAITCFQTTLRATPKDILTWEGLAEAYQHEGRYIASLKAYTRARDLDPESALGQYRVANIHDKLGMYPEAIELYKAAMEAAKDDNERVPLLMGIGESFFAQSKEYFVEGYYGRAAENCALALDAMHALLSIDRDLQCAWKLVGDTCLFYRSVPSYARLCPLDILRAISNLAPENTNALLHLPTGLDRQSLDGIEAAQVLDSETISTTQVAAMVDAILTVAGLAFKTANVLNGNEAGLAPGYWYDIGLTYYYKHENVTGKAQVSKELVDQAPAWLSVSIRCLKASLDFDETNASVWNALGVATLLSNNRISQHAFIKSMECDPRSPIPWSNLGFLYMLNSELELANQAFTMSQTLDPAFASAWAGQACVAHLWGTAEATSLFAHAFEAGTGSILEADFGYASKTFDEILQKKSSTTSTATTTAEGSTAQNNGNGGSSGMSLLLQPVFALTKYLEQRPTDIAALNLLGLIRERLSQPQAAVDNFELAIEILEKEKSFVAKGDYGRKMAILQHNLARTLLASKSYQKSVQAFQTSLELESGGQEESVPSVIRTCKHIGAGLALYFAGELEESLQMFEVALSETDQVEELAPVREDVIVFLSQVLWALEGDEQRAVAKDELFRCISQSPNHLPAIFGLCAMGLVQDDEVLATAAIKEILKFSRMELKELDPELKTDQLLSQYFSLLSEGEFAKGRLAKSIHQNPSQALFWSRLSQHLSGSGEGSGESIPGGGNGSALQVATCSVATARATLAILAQQENLNTVQLSDAYGQLSGTLLMLNKERVNASKNWKNPKPEKVEEAQKQERARLEESLLMAQRATRTAPWNLNAWQVLGTAVQEMQQISRSVPA